MDKAGKTFPRQQQPTINPPFWSWQFCCLLALCNTKMQNANDEYSHLFFVFCQFSVFPKCSWNKLRTTLQNKKQTKKNTKKKTLNRIQGNPFCFPVVPTAVTDTSCFPIPVRTHSWSQESTLLPGSSNPSMGCAQMDMSILLPFYLPALRSHLLLTLIPELLPMARGHPRACGLCSCPVGEQEALNPKWDSF